MQTLNEKLQANSIRFNLNKSYREPIVNKWKDILEKMNLKNITKLTENAKKNEDKVESLSDDSEASSKFEVKKRHIIKLVPVVNQLKINKKLEIENDPILITNELTNLNKFKEQNVEISLNNSKRIKRLRFSDEKLEKIKLPTVEEKKSIIVLKPKTNEKKSEDSLSIDSHDSELYPHARSKITKKFLSGFHPFYDDSSDVVALQCCTCCIGCWRNCSYRCVGCENFISCPIYCWSGK